MERLPKTEHFSWRGWERRARPTAAGAAQSAHHSASCSQILSIKHCWANVYGERFLRIKKILKIKENSLCVLQVICLPPHSQ